MPERLRRRCLCLGIVCFSRHKPLGKALKFASLFSCERFGLVTRDNIARAIMGGAAPNLNTCLLD